MTRGRPGELSVAYELTLTSPRTSSANRSASLRHSRAGAASNAEGPGVSRSDLRNASDSGLMIGTVREVKGRRRGPRCLPPRGEGPLQEDGPRTRVVTVRGNGPEPHRSVQPLGLGHPCESVE